MPDNRPSAVHAVRVLRIPGGSKTVGHQVSYPHHGLKTTPFCYYKNIARNSFHNFWQTHTTEKNTKTTYHTMLHRILWTLS